MYVYIYICRFICLERERERARERYAKAWWASFIEEPVAPPPAFHHRWNRTPRPQPHPFSILVSIL